MKGRILIMLFGVLVVWVLIATPAFAQERIDVIYLKNGSVVRGTIIEQIPNESIKIETSDGSVFVFKMSDVEKITKEQTSAQPSPKPSKQAGPAEPLASSYLLLNPLGFLQFGPMVDLEFRVTPQLYGMAHLRLQGLGLLAHLISYDQMAYWSTAVGGGVRYFFTSGATPNAPYVGGALEVGYNPYYGDLSYPLDAYHGQSVYLTIAANGGYRWRFDKFVMNVGGYVGVAPTVYSQWSYDIAPSVMYNGNLDATFFAMVELSLGWSLK